MLRKEARHQRVHTVVFGLHEFSELTKQTKKWEQKSDFFFNHLCGMGILK